MKNQGIKKVIFIGLVCVVMFGISNSASAWVLGEPIVPCGGTDTPPPGGGPPAPQPPCTQCELLHLVDNVVDFIMIALAPALATLFFVIAGVYIMLGGTNPGMLSQGKRIFTEALVGLLIVMLAWLFTNVLIMTLVTDTLDFGGGWTFNSAEWWEATCEDLYLDTEPPRGSGGGSTTAPVVISGVRALNVGATSATIAWTTNVSASSVVDYGVTTGYGQVASGNITNTVTTHLLILSGLTPGTTYNYRVSSTATVASGPYTARSGNYTFRTP